MDMTTTCPKRWWDFALLIPGKLGITIIQTPLGTRAYVSAIPNEFTTGG